VRTSLVLPCAAAAVLSSWPAPWCPLQSETFQCGHRITPEQWSIPLQSILKEVVCASASVSVSVSVSVSANIALKPFKLKCGQQCSL
jgi:hypothetical protein